MSVIRRANRDDVVHIKHCAEKAYAPYVDRMGKKPAPMVADFGSLVEKQLVHVLEVRCNLRGFIVCFANKDHFHIENIAVLPEFTGKGYGTQLIEFAEAMAQTMGYSRMELYTNEKMWENLTLYPKLGYEEFTRKTQDGFSRVFFFKQL